MKKILFLVLIVFAFSAIAEQDEASGRSKFTKFDLQYDGFATEGYISITGDSAKLLWNEMKGVPILDYSSSTSKSEKRSSKQVRCIRGPGYNDVSIVEYSCHIYFKDLSNGVLGSTPPNWTLVFLEIGLKAVNFNKEIWYIESHNLVYGFFILTNIPKWL